MSAVPDDEEFTLEWAKTPRPTPDPARLTLADFLRARLDEQHHTVLATATTRADPGRDLIEIAAKQAIVANYEAWKNSNTSGEMRDFGHEEGLREAMEHLAAVWSDHPDYQPDWNPAS